MLGSLGELAAMAGMPSEPTLRKLIRDDPDFAGIVKRGSNGDAYEIDLVEAAGYVRSLEQRKADAARARAADIAQLALSLGLNTAAPDPGLSLADRKALLEEQFLADRLAKSRGTLVDKASVEAAAGMFMVMLQQLGGSFSNRLALRVDLPRAVQIEMDRLMASDLAQAARQLRELARAGGDDGDGRDLAAAQVDDPADRDGDAGAGAAGAPAGAEGEAVGQ